MTDLPLTDPANIVVLSTNIEEVEWYTPSERCDACVSQSYFMVVLESGILFLCNHHFKKSEDTFFELALDIVDESELLVSGRS